MVGDDLIVELVNRLERHKAALQGISDLQIGSLTVISDYTDAIRLLLHLRQMLVAWPRP